MVANLTYPIILNATLIQPLQPLWKDWLPAIVSVAVVIIGGIITYFVTITIEERKRHYELKKQVYFEFMDQITRARRLILEQKRIESLENYLTKGLDLKENFCQVKDMYPNFDAAKLKVQVCGSDKIKNLIEAWTVTAILTELNSEKFDDITRNVTDAMREELIGKR